MGTKARILDTSLALFNQFGVAPISSLQIAGELGISPGNLYYHFRGRDEILAVLVEHCEAAFAQSSQSFSETVTEAEQQWDFLHELLGHCLRYRFIFQSLDLISRESPALARRIRALMRRIRELIGDMLLQLHEQGVITTGPEQQKYLAENLLLLCISWIQYQALLGEQEDEALIRQGSRRLFSLIEPYLQPALA